ncbi:NAD(P)-binding domain-containing protein [Tunturiibacter gelidiferens]|uniref:NAD(P)-binding domain-containing protein n=1 Tax=Tunturiibacter gelidiferens TaxID=3069689 RepID=UPI003D9B8C79
MVFPATVCDLAPEAVKRLADSGAKTEASAREAAEGNDFVLTMVRDDDISRKVSKDLSRDRQRSNLTYNLRSNWRLKNPIPADHVGSTCRSALRDQSLGLYEGVYGQSRRARGVSRYRNPSPGLLPAEYTFLHFCRSKAETLRGGPLTRTSMPGNLQPVPLAQ